jgi:hypothetical protein
MQCKLGPHCGDGIVNGPSGTEDCDDGVDKNGTAASACLKTCKKPVIIKL